MSSLSQWSDSLPLWAIPQHIIDQAPQSPWIHPVVTFTPSGDLHVDTPSRHRALEALPAGGSVLDIGCGGGRAAFGLVPPAGFVVGVDHQQGMLDVFHNQAKERDVSCSTVLGDWPQVEANTPTCDVVTCHHVLYNVADLAPFVHAMSTHARKRVVVEIPMHHPLSSLSPMWKHFWNIERPHSPSAIDALSAIQELGYKAHLEEFTHSFGIRPVTDQDVEFTRIRLCLSTERDEEIRRFIAEHPVTERHLATLWWDI